MISIYIPTRGRPKLVVRAVRSVLDQTFKNLEVIVVVDGYDPVTVDELSLIEKNDNRLSIISYPESRGACFARNVAIKKARYSYITGLDDDDFFIENHIELNLKYLVSNDYQVVFANQIFRKRNDNLAQTVRKNLFSVDLEDIKLGNVIGNQIFCKKEFLIEAGLFDENLPALQDYELWIRVLSISRKAYFTGYSTYVVDISHDHERITKSPFKVREAACYILKKHSAFFLGQEFKLFSTLYRYKGVYPKISELKYFYSVKSYYSFLKVLFSRVRKAFL